MRVTAVPNRDSLSRRIGSLKRQMKTAEPHERWETCRCPVEVRQKETAPDMNGRTTFFPCAPRKRHHRAVAAPCHLGRAKRLSTDHDWPRSKRKTIVGNAYSTLRSLGNHSFHLSIVPVLCSSIYRHFRLPTEPSHLGPFLTVATQTGMTGSGIGSRR